MASSVSSEKPSDGQVAHLKGVLEVAIRQSGRNSCQVQRMIEQEDGVKDDFIKLCQKYGLPVLPYPDEVAKRTLDYGDDFQFPDIETQRSRLVVIHGDINLGHVSKLVENLGPQPMGADTFAIRPKLSYLGTRFKVVDPYVEHYGMLLEEGFFPILSDERNFYNYRKDELTPEHIRLNAGVLERQRAIEDQTEGDVIVSWISLGINPYNPGYNWSPRNFCPIALEEGDLPLGSVDIAGLLLLFPDRLISNDQLRLDCSADEYNWGGCGFEAHCPCFSFVGGQLWFRTGNSNYAHRSFGSPVAFGSVVTRE